MALATTLMAVGIPAETANRIGYADRVPLDGNGVTQAGATEILRDNTNIAMGTSVGDTAFILPADAEYFQPYFLLNSTAETALVFPPLGDTIDDNAVDVAVEVETDLARVFQRVEEGRWVSQSTGSGGGSGDVVSVVAGTGIAVDSTDPANPVVSNTGVLSVTAGSNITIGGTAQNPTINGNAGTVTAVSIASANGFAGSSSGGATPQLTITTTLNVGEIPVVGVGGAISAAPVTGAGNVVLSGGPTLTAPNLGTPSAVNLANGTNLPLASVVGAGTAAAANIGTSGATVPLLNGANTWSGDNLWSAMARFTGPVSQTATGTDRIDIGVESGTPRIVMENGGLTTWMIDSDLSGLFRWFTPGVVQMQLAGGSILTLNQATAEINLGNPTDTTITRLAAQEIAVEGKRLVWSTAPVTKTADFTVAANESSLINNKAGSTCVVTLPTASSFAGRQIWIKNIQAQLVNSASSNVVPLAGGAAGNAILTAVAGRWAMLESDGTNWVIMAGVI